MKKVKRILVGVDIYTKVNNVLKRALMVAKNNKAELFVVYAVQSPWLSLPSYFGSKEITVDMEGTKQKIDKKLKALDLKNKVPYTVLIKEGSAHDVLGYEAKLVKADMIIIGVNTSGKNNFLGTTAEKVAHQSHLPVLVVKNSVKDTYENIAAPTDFQTQSKLSIVYAKDLFPMAKIKAVHSSETIYMVEPYSMVGDDLMELNKVAKSFARKEMKDMVKKLSLSKGKILNGEFSNKKALLKYIKKGNFDLTVVGSQGTTGFQLLLGSMASSILKETPTDVLVYVP